MLTNIPSRLLLVLIASLASVVSQAQATPDAALDALHQAASNADADAYFALFTENARFLGTDRHERWSRAEFEALYRPYMDSGRGWTYHPRDRHVVTKDDIAWFDETLWHDTYGHCRGSGVLIKTDDRWLIDQYNLTFPIPNEVALPAITLGLDFEQTRLRAMTFNIRFDNPGDGVHAWPSRANEAISLMRRTAPDIVGLQEALASQLDEIDPQLPSYERVGVGRADGVAAGEFAPIYFLADRFELIDSGTFWFSDTPDEPGSTSYGNTIPRICTWASLRDRASKRTIMVANVHLDHASPPSRAKSIGQLTAWAETFRSVPVLLMGDFNTSPNSPAAARLHTRFEIVAPKGPTFHGFRGHQTFEADPIDWLAEKGPLELLTVEAMREQSEFEPDRYTSDHDPVLATFDWPK